MKIILKLSTLAATLSIVLLPVIAGAHHSTAHFSDELTEMDGELVDVRWNNPHIVFTVTTINEGGQEELWQMEAGTIYVLGRAGVTRDIFRIGDRIRVAGRTSTRQDRRLLATNMLLGDGREVLTAARAEPRWTDNRIGGRDQRTPDERRLRDAIGESRGIFNVWSLPLEGIDHRSFAFRDENLPFRAEAVAARSAWDPVDNFVMRCEQPGMPDIMVSPFPFQFIELGTTVELHGVSFGVVRTIHMGAPANPAEQPPSPLGYSMGRWEGDTLIVETTRIDWPYFDTIGTPQSDAVETVERFILSEDQTRLHYSMTVSDPATFTGPATLEYYWLALGENLERFEYVCEGY